MANPPVRHARASAFALLVRGRDTVGGPPRRPLPPPLLVANCNFRDTLKSKEYSFHYYTESLFNGNHTLFNWRGTLASHRLDLSAHVAAVIHHCRVADCNATFPLGAEQSLNKVYFTFNVCPPELALKLIV